jgi:hypothetical protein
MKNSSALGTKLGTFSVFEGGLPQERLRFPRLLPGCYPEFTR